MIRDKEYFDDKIFVFSNNELRELLKDYGLKKQLPLYLVVDEALRDFLKSKGYEFENSPRRPQLL